MGAVLDYWDNPSGPEPDWASIAGGGDSSWFSGFDSTPIAEYSSIVPPTQQVSENKGAIASLNSFLGGLASLATPVAQIVQAVQKPQVQQTTNTGDGVKTAAPTLASGVAVGGTGISQSTLLIAGAVAVGVLAVVLISRSR